MTALAWFFIVSGLILMFFGALGTIVLGDLFQRFHASTKCGVSGTLTLLLGLSLFSGQLDFALKFLVIIVFTVISEPMVAHIVALSKMQEHALDEAEDAEDV